MSWSKFKIEGQCNCPIHLRMRYINEKYGSDFTEDWLYFMSELEDDVFFAHKNNKNKEYKKLNKKYIRFMTRKGIEELYEQNNN